MGNGCACAQSVQFKKMKGENYMKLDEFCRKTSSSNLIDPNAIKIIMEKLLEMPLSEMYSTLLNNRTKNGYANKYVLEYAGLKEYGDASKAKLKHFLYKLIEMQDNKSDEEQYIACRLMLAAWNCGFVPMNYERKKE